MPPESPVSPPASVRNPWPRVVLLLGLVALLSATGMWFFNRLTGAPAAVLEKGRAMVKEIGGQAATVAQAFREGTIRQAFFSHAAEISGTTRLQVATLKQNETFQREEAGSAAWGLVPVPKVVVQAQAPVEYSYYLDFAAPWEFRQQDKMITVLAPPLQPNTPALDVSALTFYTLEGSIWRDEGAVRDRLRESLTGSLQKRARNSTTLVREVARRQVAEFVERWLAEKFGDARDYQVQVLFPEEAPVPMDKTPQ